MSYEQVGSNIFGFEFKRLFTVWAWAIRSGDSYILVDCGFKGKSDGLIDRLESAGFRGSPELLILTHAHLDHCGAAAELAERWGVPVAASVEETPYIEGEAKLGDAAEGRQRRFLNIVGSLGLLQNPPVKVDQSLADGDVIGPLRVVSAPGHTPGQIALVHEEESTAICSDAFMNMRNKVSFDPVPGIDLDRSAARKSLQKLTSLDLKTFLPSHGPAASRQELEEFLSAT